MLQFSPCRVQKSCIELAGESPVSVKAKKPNS
jgi:hypothetical protein